MTLVVVAAAAAEVVAAAAEVVAVAAAAEVAAAAAAVAAAAEAAAEAVVMAPSPPGSPQNEFILFYVWKIVEVSVRERFSRENVLRNPVSSSTFANFLR